MSSVETQTIIVITALSWEGKNNYKVVVQVNRVVVTALNLEGINND